MYVDHTFARKTFAQRNDEAEITSRFALSRFLDRS